MWIRDDMKVIINKSDIIVKDHFVFTISAISTLILALYVGSLIKGYEAGYGLAFDLMNTFMSFLLGMGLRKILPKRVKK